MDAARYREAERQLWSRLGADPREHRIDVRRDGVGVRVQEVGAGPPVLFLHGGPNAGSTWAHLAAALLHRRCLLLDRPGTGLSDPLPHPVRPETLAAELSAVVLGVLDALDVDAVDIVASSFGGWLALQTAHRAPERVRRMVQFGCPALLEGSRVPAFMLLGTRPGVRQLVAALPPTAASARWMLRQIGHGRTIDGDRLPEGLLEWRLALERHTDTNRHDMAMVAALTRGGRMAPAALLTDALLRTISTPTHWIWGLDDPFGGGEIARHVDAVMPVSTRELWPGAGHLPWFDDVARAVDAVDRRLGAPVPPT